MSSKFVIIISSIIILVICLFLCWHFIFSIYEVKYKHNYPNEKLVIDNNYKIKCVGLNSFGWEIDYRDLGTTFTIITGSKLIKIDEISEQNQFSFSPIFAGEISIEVNSKFSLNPTLYKLQIVEK